MRLGAASQVSSVTLCDPLAVDLRRRPQRGERERDAAVDLEEERLAGLAALLGLQPLEVAVGQLQRAPRARGIRLR